MLLTLGGRRPNNTNNACKTAFENLAPSGVQSVSWQNLSIRDRRCRVKPTKQTLQIVHNNHAQGTLVAISENLGDRRNLLVLREANHTIWGYQFNEGEL
jgi:hypothetical protein